MELKSTHFNLSIKCKISSITDDGYETAQQSAMAHSLTRYDKLILQIKLLKYIEYASLCRKHSHTMHNFNFQYRLIYTIDEYIDILIYIYVIYLYTNIYKLICQQ